MNKINIELLRKYPFLRNRSQWKILNNLKNSLSFTKTSDLYHNKLYTVIPRGVNIKLGIFPDDQGFSKKAVLLWDNARELIRFSQEKFKMLEVIIPDDVKHKELHKVLNAVYSLPFISNKWQIEEIKDPPQYVQ